MAREPMRRRSIRWWGVDVAADVDAELQYHVDLLTSAYIERGHAPGEARALALRRLGDLTRVRLACVREGRRWERSKARLRRLERHEPRLEGDRRVLDQRFQRHRCGHA